ncbi:MAG: OmpA family protein, partial [Nitrospira sp.]|nr:OmpA family protein [Nitrospira sp.]
PPAPEPKPAPPAPEPKPAPEPEIVELEPSDFVPEEPEPVSEPAPAPAPDRVVDSGLADVFFDLDEYGIRQDAVPVLEKNAELLKSIYKGSGVLIEGHCDERGTVEYNLELGKRRAQAVKDYLVDLEIEESRIHIVSYGKERPFCTESDPSCWKQNRRGHFVRQ